MTHGVTDETPDGMGLAKIDAIIEALRYERYQWLPARRTYIPKKNGKKRPLGMPVWSDKLVQEVIRMLLSAYLRTPVFRPLAWVPTRTWMSYRTQGNLPHVAGSHLVHRRGHLPVF